MTIIMGKVMVRAAFLCTALALAGCGGDDNEPPAAVESRDGAAGTVLWAVGDAATTEEGPAPLAQLITESDFDRLLYLGDVYERGTLREFRRWYDPLYGDVARRTWPVIGNHEDANRHRGFHPYWRAKLGRRQPTYYERRIGGWELIALDSEAPLAPQVRWLRGRLREPTTCRIAFWHRPRFSAGELHSDDPDVDPLWKAMRGRAVAVLGGHDHNLQRFEPVDGLVQFVSGAGGRDRYILDEEDERLAFGDDDHFGALRIELRPRSARFTFVADDGEELDGSELGCER